MQSNRAPWPKRNMLVKHCCYWWFEVNIKPVPRCHFVNYNIAEVYFDKVSQRLTTCSRLGAFTCARNQSCTLISVKRSVRIHPTKTNAQHKLKQHICAAFFRPNYSCTMHSPPQPPEFWQLRTVARLSREMWPPCHSHSCARASSWGLKSSNLYTSKTTWLHLIKLHVGWFQRAGWFLSCPRLTAFFLWTVLKDQRGRKETPLCPPPPHLHSIVELTIVILTQMLYCR